MLLQVPAFGLCFVTYTIKRYKLIHIKLSPKLVEKDLLTLLWHLSSPSLFDGVCSLFKVSILLTIVCLCVCFLLPLYCLSFFSFCHYIVCPSSPFAIILSVLLLLFPLYCLSFFSFCHYIVCPSSPFAIILSVLLLLFPL